MITVMVPAYNEELYLRDTVYDIVRCGERSNVELDIIVVNDGSTDRTPEIINELEKKHPFIRSVHNRKNLGIGNSLSNLIKIAKGDKLLILPGDGDVGENEIFNLFSNANRAEMVFLYFINKEVRGRLRNILSTLYNTIHMVFFDIFVQYINGPCLYPLGMLREIKIVSKRFSIVSEVSIKLSKLGCSYYEIGGYMKRGVVGSSAISLENLIEVVISFIRLCIDVKFINRKVYNKIPVRV